VQETRKALRSGAAAAAAAAVAGGGVKRSAVVRVGGVKSRQKKRLDKLLPLIKLTEEAPHAVFSQAPVGAYDLYLRRLRSGGVTQVAVQTRGDDVTVGVQTEECVWANV
jgi:hypothetical protein